jgi:chemotaxis protein CheX
MTADSHFSEFSKPFIEAAMHVFETMVFAKLEIQKPIIKKDPFSRGDISAVLGLTGEREKNGINSHYRAMLVISFPYETFYKVASAMLGEKYTSYVPEIHDLGGEIVNMIMGNAKRDLKSMGYTSNMAVPSIIEGKDHSIKYPAGIHVILIPFTSIHGPIFMEVCFTETDSVT